MKPGSPEWNRIITASKVGAILGVSPWESPRSMWHRMRNELDATDVNDAMRRGHYLEEGVLAWWRDRHGVKEIASEWRRHPEYYLGEWAAATPDAVAMFWHDGEGSGNALVEAKTATDDSDWGDEGTDQIPAYYLAQCYWQMHVSQINRCYVPVLTSRLRFAEYVVTYDPEIGADLEKRMRTFYDSLTSDEPPPLDDSVATFDAIRKLHKDIERGEEVELTRGEALRLVEDHHAAKHAESCLRYAKGLVLDRMGRAQYAKHNGVTIARRQPYGDGTSFVVLAKPADLLEESA